MYDHIKFDTGEFKCVNHSMKMKEKKKKQKTKSKQYLKMLSAKRRANEEEEWSETSAHTAYLSSPSRLLLYSSHSLTLLVLRCGCQIPRSVGAFPARSHLMRWSHAPIWLIDGTYYYDYILINANDCTHAIW